MASAWRRWRNAKIKSLKKLAEKAFWFVRGAREKYAWFVETSLCPRCGRILTNKGYFGGKKGSVHTRGTCRPPVNPWLDSHPKDRAG